MGHEVPITPGRVPVWTAAFALPVVAAACNDDDVVDPDPDEPATIAQVVSEDADFSTLETALQEAGLADALDDEDATFTVFAPDDEAFEPINVEALLADEDALEEVLGYHVIPDAALESDELQDGDRFTTLSGDEVTIEVGEDGTVRIDGSTVTTADVEATNGIVHVVDRALLGNQDLGGVVRFVAATGLLYQLLEEAGLEGALSAAGAWTVFGPSNEAVDDAEELVEELDDEELQEVLQYHVYPEEVVTSRDLLTLLEAEEGEVTLEMLQGEELLVTLENDDTVVLNEEQAELEDGLLDFRATNGILHVIDGVLVPPSLEDQENAELPAPAFR